MQGEMVHGKTRRGLALAAAATVFGLALPLSAAAQGASWSVVPSPNATSTQNNFLSGISCVNAADCWAVGQWVESVGDPLGVSHTLVEHYDGAAWTIAPSPDGNPARDNFLQNISCVAGNDCWAAGAYRDDAGNGMNLFEHYDGSSWSISGPPTPQTGFLNDITCVASDDCWAVGFDANLNPLHEHFNG